MASTNDIRDIMNLGQSGPRQPAVKKKKRVEPQMRVAGVSREVQALMGDSVPPIAIVEQKLYKSKPSISQKLFKPRHWEERPFQHGGRKDGLILRHWKRSIPTSHVRPSKAPNSATPTDVEMTDDNKEPTPVPELRYEEEFPSHKWNVKVEMTSYTDEQYENHLKSDDWTKEETDYLIELCRSFDLRWLIIADRYTTDDIPSQQSGSSTSDSAVDGSEVSKQSQYPQRSMEALKSRYYSIAAKMLELDTPASNMTQPEFQLWEKMRTFDAKTETQRKAMAEKLFERSKDEADEEKLLLEELHRITKHEEDFIKMRRELYARLEPAPVIRRTERGEEQSTAMYQTSAGLSMLLQTLVAKEKRLKRPLAPPGVENASASGTPIDAQKWEKGRHPNQYTRRDTMDSQPEETGPQKKGSTSQVTVRHLSAAEEAKFGVSHPQERLTSGVQFRHEKINRLTMAKSQVQTSKIQAALTELGIPPRLLMPTERVCREFERLVAEINLLLEARKVSEKVTAETKILEEARRIRLGLPKESDKATGKSIDQMEVDNSQLTSELKSEDVLEDSTMPDTTQGTDGQADTTGITEKEEDIGDEDEKLADEESTMQVDEKEDDDDDADAEEDDVEAAHDQSGVAEEDEDEEEEDDEDGEPNLAEADNDDDEEQVEEDDEEDEEDDEEEDEGVEQQLGEEEDDEEEEGGEEETQLRNDTMVDQASEIDEESESAEDQVEEDEDEQENEDEQDGEEEDDHDDGEDEPAEAAESVKDEVSEPSRPASAHSAIMRSHKRSASVISESSKAGSNRSGLGRKKRR